MFAVTAASTTAIMIEMAGQERLVEACFEKKLRLRPLQVALLHPGTPLPYPSPCGQ